MVCSLPKAARAFYAPVILKASGRGAMPGYPRRRQLCSHPAGGGVKLLDRPRHPGKQIGRRRELGRGICICASPLNHRDIVVGGCEISDVTGENRRNRDVYQSMYLNSGIYVTIQDVPVTKTAFII